MTIAFGTSGLRGPASDFDRRTVAAHVGAFLTYLGVERGTSVVVGCDLRRSSPEISGHVVNAIIAHGQVPQWCGVLPTPAVAAAGLARGVPAIVITGSHIPESYNGIKFYRPDGELLKDDEAPIRELASASLARPPDGNAVVELGAPDTAVGDAYVARYIDAFGPNALSGLKLGVFEHSAAGRDLLVEIFSGLGATLHRFGRSEQFVAIDTEALEPDLVERCAAEIARHGLDAVISTDGDGDRPLLIGADGHQVTGDVLCTLAARALGIETVVTPLTSTSAIEMSGYFAKVERTRIGSPYVVAAMKAQAPGRLAGFEANGGFLLGSGLDLAAGRLEELPTRDAVLPLIAVLCELNRRSISLADLVRELPSRVMKADRIKEVPQTLSASFLAEIAVSAPLRARLASDCKDPASIDLSDGVRFGLENGAVVHFRASGNAPELRAYVETDAAETTELMLEKIMSSLAKMLKDWPDRAGDIEND